MKSKHKTAKVSDFDFCYGLFNIPEKKHNILLERVVYSDYYLGKIMIGTKKMKRIKGINNAVKRMSCYTRLHVSIDTIKMGEHLFIRKKNAAPVLSSWALRQMRN